MDVAVDMRGIVKRFGSVEALTGVDLDVRRGEIHALLGENGAGKTTLMNVLYGLVPPDEGTIEVDGTPVVVESPEDATGAGIGMVHQHFMLVPTLTVTENMVLGDRGKPVLRRSELRAVARKLEELGARTGLEVDPSARVWQLSVGEQQRVEILRALYRGARILILDEPTATLTPVETETLFTKLRAMTEEGTSVVFITHHLEEVMAWADRITVLRRGERVGTLDPRETSPGDLARMMVGRDVKLMRVVAGERRMADDADTAGGKPAGAVLRASGLKASGDRGTPALRGVSFSVAPGEILAVAGVEGNGQPELEEVLFGLRAPEEGSLVLRDEDVTTLRPARRLDRGMALVPSDRYRRGLIRELSVADNLVCDRIDTRPFGSALAVNRKAIRDYAGGLIERFGIRVSGPDQPAGTLSGGNAQRVVLARSLSRELRCLIAAQPTRGLDVGAIEVVWEQLAAARAQGLGIVLISTDLDEVMSLADRCCVLYRGELVATWPQRELDRERIGLAMGGSVATADKGADVAEGVR
jgi:general nucleoside transport system ATP-binding protein